MAKIERMGERKHLPMGRRELEHIAWVETRAKVTEKLPAAGSHVIATAQVVADSAGVPLDHAQAALEQLESEGLAERVAADPAGKIFGWRRLSRVVQ